MFDLSIVENYYKPIIVKRVFNDNYIQYESNGDEILTNEEYLNMIEPYLVGMINDYKNEGEWKIQLTLEISIISSKSDCNEIRTIYTKSTNTESMIGSDANDVISDLFKSLLQRYQEKFRRKKCEVQSLFLLALMHCIVILIK